MGDEYLWDRSGPAEPEVAELERRLAPLRGGAPAPVEAQAPRPFAWRAAWLVAAAALVVAIPFYLGFAKRDAPAPPVGPCYEVTALEGSVRVFANAKSPSETRLAIDTRVQVPVGSSLACDAGARARVRVGEIGEVIVEGPADVTLDETSEQLHKLYLSAGMLRASISPTARPRLFQVGTPAGTAVDLGCVYTMRVREDERTELRVLVGRVAFELASGPLFVGSGSRCVVDRRGAGTPVDEAADESLQRAVREYDDATAPGARSAALGRILPNARPSDGPTLWHLLRTVDEPARAAVFDRLAELAPPPDSVSREACLRGSAEALETWRIAMMGW